MTALETNEAAAIEMRLDQDLEKEKPCDDATASLSNTSRSEMDTSGSGSDTDRSGTKASPVRSSLERNDPTSNSFGLASDIYSLRLAVVKRHIVHSTRAIAKVVGCLEETTLDGAEELHPNSIAEDRTMNVNLKAPEFMEKIWMSCNAGFCNGMNADEMDDKDDEEITIGYDDRRRSPVPFNIPSKVPSSMSKSHLRSHLRSNNMFIASDLPELMKELMPSFVPSLERKNSIPSMIFITSGQCEEDISILPRD